MRNIAIAVGIALFVSACTPEYSDPKPPRATHGNPQATVVVEEFADFQCPACGAAYGLVKELTEKFGDTVYWKFYHYPLTSIHPYAFNAALAAECANDQGKFWEYHDKLFENQQKLTSGDLYDYAGQLGLNVDSFKACVKSRAKSPTVRADMDLGDQRGVNSTPSFYVNGVLIEDWSALETRINAALTPGVPVADTPASAVPTAE